MKNCLFLFAFLLISANAFAQHSIQLDDGIGDYSTILGSSSGGTYMLPNGRGTLLTSASISSTAWVLGGNLGSCANNQIRTLDGTALLFVTRGGEPTTHIFILPTA